MQREYKGAYQRGRRGESSTVPGLQEPYEVPLHPEVAIDTTIAIASEAAGMMLQSLKERFR